MAHPEAGFGGEEAAVDSDGHGIVPGLPILLGVL
jgi:hypothetical protein